MVVKPLKTKEDFDSALAAAGGKLVVIDFYADWCGPCRKISPKFEEMSDDPEYSNVVFLKVDVDENSETTETCGIRSMPTFLFYIKGEKKATVIGADESKLIGNFKEYMKIAGQD
ncbi:Thioredoxin [Trichoplax sp. H2]|nr:Thioredoxin [Trichoplax sp. H2]|eukprot:RDD38726.1 Thioredoxin [Trichoplax sp. H2]